jgi:hypothetical protein
VNYTSTILNSLANYTCTADCDFMLTRECLPDGSWSGREPECPDIACRGLENCHPENGWLSIISGSQGLVAKYGCELGYISNNTRDMRQCECGSWSGDELHCEEMCPEVGQDKECGKHSLILACDSRKYGISNTSKFHLNGSDEFFQEPLRSIQVYDNGSVHFNDGSLSIVVLNVTKNDGAHFFYDSEMSNPHYFNNQKRYVKCLLNMAMEDFNLRHMFIVTWKNYSFHDESQITFQLAIVSDSFTTYALFLYGDINLEDTPVVTGLRAELAPCHGQTFYYFPVNPVHETSPDIGISGAYILRIDKKPGGIFCNCSIDEIVNPTNGEVDIINTLRGSWAVYYGCREGFSLTGDNLRQCINGIWTGTAPECKKTCRGLGGPGCDNKALIPVCENVGNGVDKVPNETHSARVNGSFTFFGTPLHYIHIYHNGTVDFNNGSLSIAVFQTMLQYDEDTYLLYDSKGTEPGYFTAQKEYVSCLLRSASKTDFNLSDLFIVTWNDYLFGTDMKRVTFQLALASDSSSATTTYALLLYNGTNLDQHFNPSVVTGFKTDNTSCNNQSFYNFPIPLKLNREGPYHYTEGNGAYIYQIDQKPRELHCNCSTQDLDDSMSGEIKIVNTLSGSWAQYNCSNQQYQQKLCVNGCWRASFPTTNGYVPITTAAFSDEPLFMHSYHLHSLTS